MPKQTDITGTFRVPQEAWGSFWNFMTTLDGADITPDVRKPNGHDKPKRQVGKKAEGNTGRCIVLNALSGGKVIEAAELNELMVAAGKSPKSLHGLLFNMVRENQVKRTEKGYSIKAAGQTYLKNNCPI